MSDSPSYREILDLLLKNRYININEVGDSQYGNTSLIVALRKFSYREDIAMALMDASTNSNIRGDIKNLDITTKDNYIPLDSNYEDFYRRYRYIGDPPIHWAIRYDFINVTNRLIDLLTIKGMNHLHSSGIEHKTPLHLAIEYDRIGIANSLIHQTSSSQNSLSYLFKVDIHHNTPLHSAIMCNHTGVAMSLIERAEDPSYKNIGLDNIQKQNLNDETPLHLAASKNNIDVFDKLSQAMYSLGPYYLKEQLFKKDKNECSVLARAYLPSNLESDSRKIGRGPASQIDYNESDMNMFKHILGNTIQRLYRSMPYQSLDNIYEAIVSEIDHFSKPNQPFIWISHFYGQELKKEVNRLLPVRANRN